MTSNKYQVNNSTEYNDNLYEKKRAQPTHKKRVPQNLQAAQKKILKPLGARCGEIFVTNNARQWTFVCTFCNKSTRDIGDFICHIKIRHLDVPDRHSDGSEDNYYEDFDNIDGDDGNCYQEQDYLDCGNYLDVNVQTDAEEQSGDGEEEHQALFTNRLPKSSEKQFDNMDTQSLKNNKKSEIVNSSNDPESRGRMKKISDVNNSNVKDEFQSHISNYLPMDVSGNDTNNIANGESEKMLDHPSILDWKTPPDCDEQDVEQGYNATYEDDFDDDYDNPLLLNPEADVNSNSEVKAKRRQIRGTAYCALCNKTFQYYSLYRNHMIKHSNETPYKCNLCCKGFKSKQAIRYHMNTHLKEKQYKCTLCEAAYYTENQFITHILTHESSTTFPCMVCGKIYNSEKDRYVHVKTHTEERPFKCEFCGKLFRLRHHLSNHLKMHRQYKCDRCKEEFTSDVHLKKPYACPQCKSSRKSDDKFNSNNDSRASLTNEGTDINPLQLFESEEPPKCPTQNDDSAEMVTDSDNDKQSDEEDEQDQNTVLLVPSGLIRSESLYNYPSKSISKKKPYVCKNCPRSYSHLSGLNFHVRNKHR